MKAVLAMVALGGAARVWLCLGAVLAVVAGLAGLALSLYSGAWVAGLVSGAGALLGGLALLRTALRYAERLVSHAATFRALAAVRLWFLQAITPLAPLQLGWLKGGDLLNRVLSDIEALDGLYLRGLIPAVVGVVVLASVGALVVLIVPSAVFYMLGLVVLLLAALLWVAGQAREPEEKAVVAGADLRSTTLEGAQGLADLLVYDAAPLQVQRVVAVSSVLAGQQLQAGRAVSLLQAGAVLGGGLLVVGAVWLASAAGLAPALAVVLVLLVAGLGEALAQLAGAAGAYAKVAAAATRVLGLARTPPLVPAGGALLPKGPCDIVFDGVGLSYAGRPLPVLQNIHFTIKAGERVLLGGPSGVGKTSLLYVLLKFVAPSQGQVMLGGLPLTALDGDAVRAQIAHLSQRTALLSGTIEDNLRLARPSAAVADLWQALEDVQLAGFVRSLPQGLETWVGEGGGQLSGGQARRLALAQFLLKDAAIWLLDEPTEGVDAETAAALLAGLAKWAAGRTVVLVSHQPEVAAALGCGRQIRLMAGKGAL